MRSSAEQRHEDHLASSMLLARTNLESILPSTLCATLQCDKGNGTPKMAGAIARRRARQIHVYGQHQGNTHEVLS
jgi:hypothetical protein